MYYDNDMEIKLDSIILSRWNEKRKNSYEFLLNYVRKNYKHLLMVQFN